MEWKNYKELEQINSDTGNKYGINLDENMELNSHNNQVDIKKFLDNNFIGQDQEDKENENEKMNYYFWLNNLEKTNSDCQYFTPKHDIMKSHINFSNQKNNNLDIPFLNYEEEKKINKISSDLNNCGNKKKKIKKLFKIKKYTSTSKGDKNGQNNINMKNKEKTSDENNNEYINNNYQTMPLKERMKIKKEKTKKLLENKTQRLNIKEESKENNIDKNSISNNIQENISGYICNNNSTNYNNNNSVINNYSLNQNVISNMSKKEIKMLRNRLSAQKSRDRKKKELIELRTIAKNLFEENEKLRNEIRKRDDKINKLLNMLCPACKENTKNNNLEITIQDINIDTSNNIHNDGTQLTPSNIAIGKKKMALLMAGLFTIFCIFGAFMTPNGHNIIRLLKEKKSIENKNNNEKRVNVPFIIEKDYTIRHKKEIEMYKKIQKNNLKNKNLMVPASVFKNNSEQILSNISNSINSVNNTNEKNKTIDDIKKTIHDDIKNNNKNNNSTNFDFGAKFDRGKEKTNENNNQNYKIVDN